VIAAAAPNDARSREAGFAVRSSRCHIDSR
jgi:hypothetical protein